MQNDFFGDSTSGNALGIFCRAPRLGEVKTRLAATRGDEFALGLYRAMLRDTFDLARQLAPDVTTFAVYTPDDGFVDEAATNTFVDETFLDAFWDGPRVAQCKGDLGDRMLDAFAQLRSRGFERVVLVGSDSPDMWLAWLRKAFRQLEHVDSVVGYANDGGFWIFGASKPLPSSVFDNVIWSGPTVANQISGNIKNQKPARWRGTTLSQWFDCDDENDLKELRWRLRGSNTYAPHTKAWLEQNP